MNLGPAPGDDAKAWRGRSEMPSAVYVFRSSRPADSVEGASHHAGNSQLHGSTSGLSVGARGAPAERSGGGRQFGTRPVGKLLQPKAVQDFPRVRLHVHTDTFSAEDVIVNPAKLPKLQLDEILQIHAVNDDGSPPPLPGSALLVRITKASMSHSKVIWIDCIH